jgi:hypothetical protein
VLEGDVTAVVSGVSVVSRLRDLLAGTEVGDACRAVVDALRARAQAELLFRLRPPGRRQRIGPQAAEALVRAGGLLRGDGSSNFFDACDPRGNYRGSVRTRVSVFKTDVHEVLPSLQLRAYVKTDRAVHPTSQGVYYAMPDSVHAVALRAADLLATAEQRLRAALTESSVI